jgi:hypothetical protein
MTQPYRVGIEQRPELRCICAEREAQLRFLTYLKVAVLLCSLLSQQWTGTAYAYPHRIHVRGRACAFLTLKASTRLWVLTMSRQLARTSKSTIGT